MYATYDSKTKPEKHFSIGARDALHGLICFVVDTTCETFWHIFKIWNMQHNAHVHKGTQEYITPSYTVPPLWRPAMYVEQSVTFCHLTWRMHMYKEGYVSSGLEDAHVQRGVQIGYQPQSIN